MRTPVTPFVLPVGPQTCGCCGGDAKEHAHRSMAKAMEELFAKKPLEAVSRHTRWRPKRRAFFPRRRRLELSYDYPIVWPFPSLGVVFAPEWAFEQKILLDVEALLRDALKDASGIVGECARQTTRPEPDSLATFRAAPPPGRVFEPRDWSALQQAVAAILHLLEQLVELLLNLLRALPVRLAVPPPQPAYVAPCAVARLQGTRVPRAPQLPLSRFSLAS